MTGKKLERGPGPDNKQSKHHGYSLGIWRSQVMAATSGNENTRAARSGTEDRTSRNRTYSDLQEN